MNVLDRTSWEVLNATADDCENLEQIYRQICYEFVETPDSQDKAIYDYRPITGAPLLSGIADRIRDLVEAGLLAVEMDEEGRPVQGLDDLSYVWRAWFRMTAEGRNAWVASEHAILE